MKCPKCGYLGFDDGDRCRNCGYEFALDRASAADELSLRSDAVDDLSGFPDLALVDAPDVASATPASPIEERKSDRALAQGSAGVTPELPLFSTPAVDDEPLIKKASTPRPPLAVRRASAEVPRVRGASRPTPPASTTPMLDLAPADTRRERRAPRSRAHVASASAPWTQWTDAASGETAGLGSRMLAMLIDLLVVASVDVVAIYFAMKICGLTLQEWHMLPKVPLAAFIMVQNGAYFIAFTAGGQTLGKLITGIRVVSIERHQPIGIGRSSVRALFCVLMALPAGLGFLTTLLGSDRRGLHDRFAGSRVVRAGV